MSFSIIFAIISSVIAAATSAISAVTTYKGVKTSTKAQLDATNSTNQTNYDIWKEQQAHNTEMYEKQTEDSIKLWQMQSEYNSASNVRKRYEEAGLNPVLNMQGGSGVTGASAINQPTMQTAQPPTMQTPGAEAFQDPLMSSLTSALSNSSQMLTQFDMLGRGISDIRNTDANTDKTVQETAETIERVKGMKIDNEFKAPMLQTQWDIMQQDFKQKQLQFDIDQSTAETRKMMVDEQYKSMRAVRIYNEFNAKEKEISYQFFEARQNIELANLAQDLVNKQLQGDLTKQQVKNAIATRAEIYARTNLTNKQAQGQENQNRITSVEADKAEGLQMTKEQLSSLSDALYDAAYMNAKNQWAQSNLEEREAQQWLTRPNTDKFYNHLNRIGRSFGSFFGARPK